MLGGGGGGGGAGGEEVVSVVSVVVVSVVVASVVAGWYGSYDSVLGPRSHGCHCGSSAGSVQSRGGIFQSARSMNRCQISAGKLPPKTAMPCTLSMGISPCG